MSLSSEQRPQNSNSQLNRITLSGLADRAVDGAEAPERSAGGEEGMWGSVREKVIWKQEVNDGKSRKAF